VVWFRVAPPGARGLIEKSLTQWKALTGTAPSMKLQSWLVFPLFLDKYPQISGSNYSLVNAGDVSILPTYRKPFDIIAEGLSCLIWLPGRDSNPRPIGYKCPDISARLGLSHHPPEADVGRCGGLLGGVLNL
jgi:hypothetical protein